MSATESTQQVKELLCREGFQEDEFLGRFTGGEPGAACLTVEVSDAGCTLSITTPTKTFPELLQRVLGVVHEMCPNMRG